eukprot:TRINITY_DN93756_c0_g1_i1.p1 TRINITY_DN93756_c0_g1~~TRINITY_DN93756_c0_g1_i1.p1  ORF type:complete len:601 (+),score=106.52 TRINITY_DN93756_c0_g1_i1:92-1894(+)
MKAMMERAFTALLLLTNLASASRLRANVRTNNTKGESCPGNNFPLEVKEYEIVPCERFEGVFDTDKFETALGDNSNWDVGSKWTLSLTITSTSDRVEKMGFSGGGGGFLEFTIEPHASGKRITVTDTVKTKTSSLEYRGSVVQGETVTPSSCPKFTIVDICLTPAFCGSYECTAGWKKKVNSDLTVGESDQDCCQQLMCNEYDCSSSTKYLKKSNPATIVGHTDGHCCDEIKCETSMCNSTKLKNKAGDGILGSTVAECCEENLCGTYECSDATQWAHKGTKHANGSFILGSTDQECCDEKWCDTFECIPASQWEPKAGRNGSRGSTNTECCSIMFCENNDPCSPSTQYAPRGNGTFRTADKIRLVGSTVGECCDKQYCSNYTCSNSSFQVKPTPDGGEPLLGKSDEECCEAKYCKDYTCSDSFKWSHKSNHVDGNGNPPRRGWSDAECCDPIYCESHVCAPSSKYNEKSAAELAGLQGSTNDVCCSPILCTDHTCGDDSKWVKMPAAQAQITAGSTDEECCNRKYCKDWFTEIGSMCSVTTKYSPKDKANEAGGVQGSNDLDCCDPLECSIFKSCPAGKSPKPTGLGSTEGECCVLDSN